MLIEEKLKIDVDFLLIINSLEDKFLNSIEDLSCATMDFWSGFLAESF